MTGVASSLVNLSREEENMKQMQTAPSSFTPQYAGMSDDIAGKIATWKTYWKPVPPTRGTKSSLKSTV
jgi:hypothetical protein